MTSTNTDTPTGQALAKVENSPRAMVARYQDSFAAVLPTHITRPETWIRVAQGALKKGRRYQNGPKFELEVAAENNPAVFLATLLDCARLGLEPGTEQYYLTARKVKGKLEILGIIGYQGHIELMYRAGAISTVIAENVYTNDVFVWRPGSLDTEMIEQGRPPRWQGPQTRPFHDIDWDADRGGLRLVYAYALMKDSAAVSKVVVLNREAIERIKASSQGATGEYSPWVKHEPAMWLKSSVRQLQKWIPTSAEYRNQQVQGTAALETQRDAVGGDVGELPVPSEDSFNDDEVVDAELVDDADDLEPPFTDDEPTPGSFE